MSRSSADPAQRAPGATRPTGVFRPAAVIPIARSTIRRARSRVEARLARPRRTSVGRELQSICRSLASIVRGLGRMAPAFEHAAGDPARPQRAGRKLRLSRARRASLRLQGQYMGYLRSLKPRQKARVKALRATKGVRPAIALARGLSRRTPRKGSVR